LNPPFYNDVQPLRQVKTLKATSAYAATIHSHLLQGVVADLDKAFQNFFRRVEAGERPGYPRFKGRNRFDSLVRWSAPPAANGMMWSTARGAPASEGLRQ
jgi:hypothetical protein